MRPYGRGAYDGQFEHNNDKVLNFVGDELLSVLLGLTITLPTQRHEDHMDHVKSYFYLKGTV